MQYTLGRLQCTLPVGHICLHRSAHIGLVQRQMCAERQCIFGKDETFSVGHRVSN